MQKRLGLSGRIAAAVGVALSLVAGSAGAIPIAGQGSWEQTLLARDINHDGQTDAFYDTVLNVTWLADANYAKTSGYATERPFVGAMNPVAANEWAAQLDIYGVTDWRLPYASPTAGGGQACLDQNSNATCKIESLPNESELAHLYFDTLGNSDGQTINTGLFDNVQTYAVYATSTILNKSTGQHFGLTFDFGRGVTTFGGELAMTQSWGWAVHDGDVGNVIAAPVPEPSSWMMLFLGLAGVAYVMRRADRRRPR